MVILSCVQRMLSLNSVSIGASGSANGASMSLEAAIADRSDR
jgi:hypothetical protein